MREPKPGGRVSRDRDLGCASSGRERASGVDRGSWRLVVTEPPVPTAARRTHGRPTGPRPSRLAVDPSPMHHSAGQHFRPDRSSADSPEPVPGPKPALHELHHEGRELHAVTPRLRHGTAPEEGGYRVSACPSGARSHVDRATRTGGGTSRPGGGEVLHRHHPR